MKLTKEQQEEQLANARFGFANLLAYAIGADRSSVQIERDEKDPDILLVSCRVRAGDLYVSRPYTDAEAFDDLMNDIMMEMDEQKLEPTHAVLMKFIQRYPAFKDRLTSFFATWAIQRGLTPVSQDDT